MRIKIDRKTGAITYIGQHHQYQMLERIPSSERSEALGILHMNGILRESILGRDFKVGKTPMDEALGERENWET